MKRNGMYALNFNAPALDGGEFIYLRGKHLMGSLVVLCFLPCADILTTIEIDRHAQRFRNAGATLIIVSSGERPLHRFWTNRRGQSSIIILADPCRRLHRLFAVRLSETSPVCQTFVIDRNGILRLHLRHDFVHRDLEILSNMIGTSNLPMSEGRAAMPTAGNIETECFASVTNDR